MMFLVLTGEKYLVEAESIEDAQSKIDKIDYADTSTSVNNLIENGIQYLETDTWVERII
jgi:hypothetical protein